MTVWLLWRYKGATWPNPTLMGVFASQEAAQKAYDRLIALRNRRPEDFAIQEAPLFAGDDDQEDTQP